MLRAGAGHAIIPIIMPVNTATALMLILMTVVDSIHMLPNRDGQKEHIIQSESQHFGTR